MQLFPRQVHLSVLACLRQNDKHYMFGICRWIYLKTGFGAGNAEVKRELGKFIKENFVETWEADPSESNAGPRRRYYRLNLSGHHHVDEQIKDLRFLLNEGSDAMRTVLGLLEKPSK